MEKCAAILDAVEQLKLSIGPGAFDVVDYWPDDPNTIGIAQPGGYEPSVCILTAGKTPGRYDVEHGGKVFRDCLIQGLEWAVRHELKAEPSDGGDDEGRIDFRDFKTRRGPRR